MDRPSACIAPVSASRSGWREARLISIVSGCYNEEENVRDCYEQVKKIFQEIGRYRYEHIFIDNASKDKTVRDPAGNRRKGQKPSRSSSTRVTSATSARRITP